MAYCANCGNNAGEFKFCPECGTPVGGAAPAGKEEAAPAFDLEPAGQGASGAQAEAAPSSPAVPDPGTAAPLDAPATAVQEGSPANDLEKTVTIDETKGMFDVDLSKLKQGEAKGKGKTKAKEKKKMGKGKIALIVLAALFVLSLPSMCSDGSSSDQASSPSNSADQQATQVEEAASEEPAEEVAEEPAEVVALESIEVTYWGSTEAGTVLDDQADFEVVGTYSDGTTATLDDWSVAKNKKLKAGETTQVKIVAADGVSQTVKVKCTTESKAQYKESCKSISYEKLSRYPDKYQGERVKFTGKVIQVLEDGMGVTLRVEVTEGSYGIWDDAMMVYFENQSGGRILEDDIVTFYGESTGIYTYESVLGAEISVPSVYAKYLSVN